MNLINCTAKLKSFILACFLVAVATIILLEISSYFMFEPLTGEKFSYASSATARLEQIDRLKNGLDAADFQENALYQFHPYVGYINKPGAHPWSQVDMTFNDYGMSSAAKRTYPYKKKQNEFVMAVLGGSVAEIFANTGEGYLNHYLRTSYGIQKDVVFVNLATGGYKQPQQLFYLQYALLSGFEFDAVLNIDGFNDLVLASVNLDQGVHPVFPSAGHIGLLSKIQTNTVLDRHSVEYLSTYYRLLDTQLAILSLMQKKPFRYSIFLALAEEMLTKKYDNNVKNLKYDWTIEASQTLAKEYRGPRYENSHGSLSTAIDIWLRASAMTFAICKANNLPYIQILQPNQYVEDSKPMSAKEKAVAINPDNNWGVKVRQGWAGLASAGGSLKESGVSFYDFSRIFQHTDRILYVDDCCHFNEEGNKILAKNLAEIVKDIL